ncbi:hypothetical protein AeRB84_017161 [Aphanomyces euteiches]|nr:hypothetical protein AeRB84_017161 [Aphanomyces euteiches]
MRAQIEAIGYSSRSDLKKLREKGVGTSLSLSTESIIVQWVQDMRNEGIPVAKIMLQLKARELTEEQGISSNEFKASRDWCESQDKEEGGEEVLTAFGNHIREIMADNNITKCYNADQTGVFYEYLPKRTLNARGAKTVWVRCGGKDKERATAMLLGDSEGNKYPLFIILKQRKSTVPSTVQENIEQRTALVSIQIYGNLAAWWNEDLSLAFLRFHFGSRANMDEKVLLIWDDFSAHFTDKVRSYANEINVVLEKVPPRFTWSCQPADVTWNKPLKAKLHRYWVDALLGQIKSHDAPLPFRMQPPSRSLVVQWINEAWDALPARTIISGFRKANLILECAAQDDTMDMSESYEDSVDDIAIEIGNLSFHTDACLLIR